MGKPSNSGDNAAGGLAGMLHLTNHEQAWLDAYREALDKKHPGMIHEMLIYGSKARGQAHAESDLDVLLIVKNEAGALKRELRRIGYLLAATAEALPSILAYTEEEWENRKRSGSTFRKAVERDAVRVV
jgi:predicted nucleotidyltransferase